jgi:hypothetical protein
LAPLSFGKVSAIMAATGLVTPAGAVVVIGAGAGAGWLWMKYQAPAPPNRTATTAYIANFFIVVLGESCW